MSQLTGVHIVIEGGRCSASVTGVDHRLPSERPCSVGAAIALASAGVPTALTTDHSMGEGDESR